MSRWSTVHLQGAVGETVLSVVLRRLGGLLGATRRWWSSCPAYCPRPVEQRTGAEADHGQSTRASTRHARRRSTLFPAAVVGVVLLADGGPAGADGRGGRRGAVAVCRGAVARPRPVRGGRSLLRGGSWAAAGVRPRRADHGRWGQAHRRRRALARRGLRQACGTGGPGAGSSRPAASVASAAAFPATAPRHQRPEVPQTSSRVLAPGRDGLIGLVLWCRSTSGTTWWSWVGRPGRGRRPRGGATSAPRRCPLHCAPSRPACRLRPRARRRPRRPVRPPVRGQDPLARDPGVEVRDDSRCSWGASVSSRRRLGSCPIAALRRRTVPATALPSLRSRRTPAARAGPADP